MADFPTSIKLNGLTFAVERVKDLQDEGGTKCAGLFDSNEQTIEIDTGIRSHDKVRFVMCHEITHAIEEHAGVTLKDPVQVDAFARGFYSLICDNPDLIAWLREPKPVRRKSTEETPNGSQTVI